METTERPVAPASPLPLGFLALFTATTTYAVVQLGWIPKDSAVPVAIGVLTVAVWAQVVAAAFGFASGNTTVGTAMGLLAGTWAAVAVTTMVAGSVQPSDPLGVLLLCSGAAMLVPALAGSGPPIASVVMVTTSVRFAVTGIAEIVGSETWMTAAGIVGLVLAVVSFYAAVAMEAVSTGRAELPLAGRNQRTTDQWR
ncbi:hypothetical protein [Mycolicibacterium pyrenivorans]|uniref:hypothetical protein n=1 Tax=Mycolicibacterium pyrenivorans TaxID=187102 RepID=UPI0021F3C4A2|nr:hypothetical protein [Mycolicibacterium pyrenivorans]MCV7154398.1 hypothetical protein [Mycolicibacterium pyrenivorans]